ncbi:MAG: restriction endonuclease subunit S [Campylobacter sp.]|nr:restriction endonuclease subunit S [Campylobacter sp.]
MEIVYKQIKDFGDIVTGKTPSTSDEENFSNDYPFITPSDIGSFFEKYIENTERGISKKGSNILKNSRIPENSICVVCIGSTIGKMCFTNKDSFTNQQLNSLIPNKDYNPHYLFYLLRYFKGFFQLIGAGTGSGKGIVNKTTFSKIRIPVFENLEFQNKIASILSAYDDLIEVNNKKIKTLNEMTQEIYKEWFVRFRFPGHEKVEFQNGIPKRWEIVKLEKFGYDIESGNRPKGGIDTTLTNGIPSLGAEHIKTLGFFDYNDIKLISSDFYEQMKKGVGKDKNILLYKDGAYIGKVTIFMDDFPFKDYAVNEHVFLINAKEQAYQFYLYYTLNQTHYFLQMQNLNRNSAQPGLTPADLNILKLMKPEIKIIEKFNNVIHSILKNIFSLSKTNEKLKTQRDLLLPRLMSGKLEVKG